MGKKYIEVITWVVPGSTATPGQPAVEQEQAPNLHQYPKN